MWETSIITSAGAKLLSGWVAGRTLTVDGARAGCGVADDLAERTALTDERQALSIARWEEIEGGARCEIIIDGPEEGYVANQIGLWAHLDGGESVLFAIYQDERGIDVPSKQEMPEFRYVFYALIALSGGGELQVTVDPALCGGHWYHGTGSPEDGDEGRVGDFYLDGMTGDVYRREAEGWAWEGNLRHGGGAGLNGVPLGAKWHTGTGVTGEATEGTAFPDSGVERAAVGECYLNTLTGNVYKCVSGGDANAALWQYVLCLRGPEGEAGERGNVNVSFGTEDLRDGVSSLESGLMYFVYEGAAKLMSVPMESLIGVPLAAKTMALAPMAASSEAYTVWYDGDGITGTPEIGTAYPGSGVVSARAGDFYKNASGRLYRCVQGGGPEAALWVYLMDLRGKTGDQGPTGGLYVAVGTDDLIPGESALEAGKFYFVYDGQGAVSEARSWYANAPVAASEAAGSYVHAGSVETYAALPESAQVGDVYDVRDTGMNYRWDGQRWDELGARIDVASDEEADAVLNDAFGQ